MQKIMKDLYNTKLQKEEPKPCSHCGIIFDGPHFCIGSSQQLNESDEEYEMRKSNIIR